MRMPDSQGAPMQLTLVRHLWGVPGDQIAALPRFRDLGFGAIETPLTFLAPAAASAMVRAIADLGLGLVIQDFTCRWERNRSVDDHLASLRGILAAARPHAPVLVNIHGGSDHWPLAEMIRYHREAERIAADFPVPVVHETHRSRCLYSPWISREILEAVPGLRITADFSHWVVVAERCIDDQPDILRLAAERTVHVHARVGHSQGPQVPDPRAPEYAHEVAAHERWWDLVWDAQRARGQAVSWLTPEFGPAPYLPHLPYANVPVADLDAVCTWQAHRQRDRFRARFAAGG
ncbi:MAG: hypothetical protein RLZZ127_1314 [Planctomycetota bacterium]